MWGDLGTAGPLTSSRTSLGFGLGSGLGRWTWEVQSLPGEFVGEKQLCEESQGAPSMGFCRSQGEGLHWHAGVAGRVPRQAPLMFLKAARGSVGGQGRALQKRHGNSRTVGENVCSWALADLEPGTACGGSCYPDTVLEGQEVHSHVVALHARS